MTEYQKYQAKKFVVSLAWNFGVFGSLAALNVLSEGLTTFNLSPTELTIATLVVARITKVLNVYMQSNQPVE